MGWKDDARRTIVGEKRFLETFEGYWIKPKKFSKAAEDAINEQIRKLQKGINRKALVSVTKKAEERGEELGEMSETEVLELLTEEELEALMDGDTAATFDLCRVKLRYGIDSHNFCDGDIETRFSETVDDTFARDLLEYPEISGEILGIIQEFNRPLPNKKSPKSETSPNGSTKA